MGKWLISPLFHEGAQNLRATPPCAVLILPSDFDPQARGKRALGDGSVFGTGRRERFLAGGWIRSEDIRGCGTMGRRAKSA
jgi:hypothetical protein